MYIRKSVMQHEQQSLTLLMTMILKTTVRAHSPLIYLTRLYG